jgi:hypothetical protein
MNEDNVQMGGVALGRWVIFAGLLVASLLSYFLLSPRVAPAIRPPAAQETP